MSLLTLIAPGLDLTLPLIVGCDVLFPSKIWRLSSSHRGSNSMSSRLNTMMKRAPSSQTARDTWCSERSYFWRFAGCWPSEKSFHPLWLFCRTFHPLHLQTLIIPFNNVSKLSCCKFLSSNKMMNWKIVSFNMQDAANLKLLWKISLKLNCYLLYITSNNNLLWLQSVFRKLNKKKSVSARNRCLKLTFLGFQCSR